MILVAVGLFLLSTLNTTSSIMEIIIFLLVLGVGMGIFSSPNTSAVMGCVDRGKLGVASGTLSTMRQLRHGNVAGSYRRVLVIHCRYGVGLRAVHGLDYSEQLSYRSVRLWHADSFPHLWHHCPDRSSGILCPWSTTHLPCGPR